MRDEALEPMSEVDPESLPDNDELSNEDLVSGAGWDGVVGPEVEEDVIGSETVIDDSNIPAEEAAIRVTTEDEAPGLAWDDSPGYLDDEPSP